MSDVEDGGARLATLLAGAGVKPRSFAAGEEIFAEGSLGTVAYLVVEGTVHVLRGGAGQRKLVGVVEAGAIFGEAAFLDATPRLASTAAATPCRLLEIPGADLPAILAAAPDVAMELVRVFSARLRLANTKTRQARGATELSHRLIAGVEADVVRLATELADGPRRTLAVCLRLIETCMQRAMANPARAAADLERLAELAHELTSSLAVQISVLASEGFEGEGMARFLRRRLTVVQLDTGVRIRLDWPRTLHGQLSAATEKAVFDLVDSSVSTAHLHGRARTIEIDLRPAGTALEIDVAHDGAGFDLAALDDGRAPEAKSEIEALRDRALLLSGGLDLTGRTGGGVVLRFRIPRQERMSEARS